MTDSRLRFLLGLAYMGAALAAAYLFVRYLLPWTAPFLIAFALAAMGERYVRRLVEAGWSRSLAAGMLTVTAAGVVGAVLFFAVSRCIVEVTGFSARLPAILEGMGAALSAAEERALALTDRVPEGVRGYLSMALDAFSDALYTLPAVISEKLLGLLGALAQQSPSVLLFTVTAGIGLYFISASYPEIAAFTQRQIPMRFRSRLRAARESTRGTLGRFLRAQLFLAALTFLILLPAMALLGVRGAVTLSAVIALVDALPVLGAGTVLLPWALWCLIAGDTGRGLGLALTYAVITVARSCMQPRIVGRQLGLHPAASLLAIYVGWCACGVWGMLLFPVLAVVAKRLNDCGAVSLWRSEDGV